MIIQAIQRTEFENFNDGICTFHVIDDDGNAGEVKEKLRFQNRTVGVRRQYMAMQDSRVTIDRMIRVSYQEWLNEWSTYTVEIDGQLYDINEVQNVFETLPRSQNVTLKKTKQRGNADGSF